MQRIIAAVLYLLSFWQDIVVLFFAGLSIAVAVTGFILLIRSYRKKAILLRTMSYGLIGVVGASALCLFLPVYFFDPSLPCPTLLSAVPQSIQKTIALFLGDFQFLPIEGVSDAVNWLIHVCFIILAAVAPLLAISCLLVLVIQIFQHFRVEYFSANCDLYVFNELTPTSVTIAKSIVAQSAAKNKRRIVFCDVFDEETEKSHNLLSKARELNAVCYKDDLLAVDKKLRRYYEASLSLTVNYFLVGEDETENIHQACSLSEYYQPKDRKKHRQIELFVLATEQSHCCVLDSLTMSKADDLKAHLSALATEELCTILNPDDPQSFDEIYTKLTPEIKKFYTKTKESLTLTIHRIDPYTRLVWKTLMDPAHRLYSPAKPTVSVLIAGVSHYGLEFLKTICWMYQLPDVHDLHIHVVDKRDDLRDYLMGICPELITYGEKGGDGDARFTITLHEGVDVFSGSFEALIRSTPELHDASAAFVCLGEDSLNTDAALHIRRLFTRYDHRNTASIFAVVYDGILHRILCPTDSNTHRNLLSPDHIPYDITFIGALESQYSYTDLNEFNRVADNCDEQIAFYYHVAWAFCDSYKKLLEKEKTDDAATAESIKPEDLIEQFISYYTSEYYRRSSLAACMHKQLLNPTEEQQASFTWRNPDALKDTAEDTPAIREMRRLEHARWNCYMRGEGFVYDANKSLLAHTHRDLVLYDRLDPLEKNKDYALLQ